MSDVLADQDARDRIAGQHGHTLFVEAGAGSGKTSALVSRLVSLVVGDPGGSGRTPTPGVDVESIAAITFTEAAAAELRARVRQTLEDVAAGRPVRQVLDTPAARRAAADALDRLDRSTICTLHAFAQRLLLAAPVEAGLPPSVEVHDDISSVLRFEERWRRFERRLLDDDDLATTMRTALGLGIGTDQLQVLAAMLGQNWDLVEEAQRHGQVDAARDVVVDPSTLPVDAWISRIEALLGSLVRCRRDDDRLVVWTRETFEPLLLALRSNRTDPHRSLAVVRAASIGKSGGKGKAGDWEGDGKAETAAAATAIADDIDRALAGLTDAVLTRLGGELAAYTLEDAAARRREGRLEFHDLLVLARGVLRTHREVRARFHRQYQRLLIDEFQDTDPLQIELAVRIAADPDHDPSTPWDEVTVEPGRLFFVGDPKQSIYRFRRADIDLFSRTARRYADGYTSLQVNFRTVAPVLRFCNVVFAALIAPATDTADEHGRVAQPDYVPLLEQRPALPHGSGPPVVLLGDGAAHPAADAARQAEALDVAAVLRRAHTESWAVDDHGRQRPCRWSDMAILLPSRTTLPRLRDALDDAEVPYRIESGTLVYGTTEVNDLLAVLRAIDDPGDGIAVAGALRSPAYGCGDDDLARWVDQHGHLSYLGLPADLDPSDPVAAGLLDLRQRHRRAPFHTVPEIVDAVVHDRRLLELCLVGDRHRDAWRLYRVVQEDARQFADAEPGGLRAFLRWAALQRDDKIRATSPVIPEADVDAVRIMTVHASKGLEFGIVVVSGLSAQDPQGVRGATVQFRPSGGFDIRMRTGLETARFQEVRTLEETMDSHERIRLLYVALTRARDHLVVSTHHTGRARSRSHGGRIVTTLQSLEAPLTDLAEWFTTTDDHAPADGDEVTNGGAPDPVAPERVEGLRPADPEVQRRWDADTDEWTVRRSALLRASDSGGVVSATAVARHLDGEPADGTGGARTPGTATDEVPVPDGEPWRRGRAGTAIGSAVHAVLQHAELSGATADEVAALARWQADVEGVPEAAPEIARKAEAALSSALVRRAVAAPRRWREVHVAAPVTSLTAGAEGGAVDLFEGFVDLLFEDDDGALVVVDYKTDAVRTDAEVAAALARYAPQGAAYALGVEAAVGRPVSEVHFLFVRDDGVTDAVVADLDAQRDRVRRALVELARPDIGSGGETTAATAP